MIIDIYFEGDNGAENIGTITLDNGVLGGTSDFARKLISRPLALGPVQAKGIPSPPVEVEERDGGMYWIDPDGLGIGDGAIYVHCDMSSG